MKKIILTLTMSLATIWVSIAWECFVDPVLEKNEPWVIVAWVNLRTAACMSWSDVIKTLWTNTKVRIIAVTDWRIKIVDKYGKFGRVWANFIRLSDIDDSSYPVRPAWISIALDDKAKPIVTTVQEELTIWSWVIQELDKLVVSIKNTVDEKFWLLERLKKTSWHEKY